MKKFQAIIVAAADHIADDRTIERIDVDASAAIADAISAGFIGEFYLPEVRRTAFWFLIFGPLLMLAGHVGVHAVAVGDLALLKILGIYSFFTALIGVAAFPKSPFWAALISSPFLIAAGYGVIS